ncbi:MAG: hypothetical protein PHI16_01515 [Methanocellales archaeon]|nr:hypothetical protein [Methanocellales archaeon]
MQEARRSYIATGLTNSITDAVAMLYKDQQNLFVGIKQRISTKDGHRPQTILDNYIRPACPTCNDPLFLKSKCSGLQAGDYFYIWLCKKCGFEEYTELTLMEIVKTLKPKESYYYD